MKNILTYTIAPMLALLAAGCATPTAMQSTEYDDMYYSKADKTVFIQPEVQADEQQYQAEQNQETQYANPEYDDSQVITQNYSGDEYYDGRTYDARDNWYQPNYSYVDPSWGRNYVPSYSSRYSYFYNDPFYDPFYGDSFFYNPYGRRGYWGSGLSINIGYNMGWGRNPYYSSWYPHNNFYNGYYRGFYDGFYSGNPYYRRNNFYYDAPIVYGQQRRVQYGPRDTRGGTVASDRNTNRTRTERTEAIQAGDRGRPERGGRSRTQQIVTPSENVGKESLPARPSRNGTYDSRSRQGRSVNEQQPSVQPQEQRSTTPAPARETRRTRRQESSVPSQPRYEQPQRQIRTQESQPSRSYESRPSRSDSSPSYSPSNNSNSGSSGGGRPRRGN
ncbi:hypothetical protein [Pontibacter arcticus]|uniref:Vitellogenin II n=1 Tax=Pontibacter arcticus TaxID=2080288 RepID=A0A364RIL3_9BACT|nr:hypothetical protein [Pontibacter arcticus]RAU84142.1 hypothetical protein DP923_03600 [Pontibacter arcticus]